MAAQSRDRPAKSCPLTSDFLRAGRRELFALLFHDIVHDVGNALGNVQGRAEMMLHRSLTEETRRKYLTLIVEKTEGVIGAFQGWVAWLDGRDLPGAGPAAPAAALAEFAAPLLEPLQKHNLGWATGTLPASCPPAGYRAIEGAALGLLAILVREPPPWMTRVLLEAPDPARITLTLTAVPAVAQREGGPPPPSSAKGLQDYLKGRAAALREHFAGLPASVRRQGSVLSIRWESGHG